MAAAVAAVQRQPSAAATSPADVAASLYTVPATAAVNPTETNKQGQPATMSNI